MKNLEKIVNSGKEIIVTSLLAGALSFSPFLSENSQAQENQDRNKKPKTEEKAYFIDLKHLGFTFKKPLVTKVKGVPIEIRDVPRHPKDTYVSRRNAAPIANDSVELGNGFSIFGAKVGRRISLGEPIKAKVGIGFSGEGIYGNDIRRRNYTNAVGTEERGYGAALTYYQLRSAYFHNFNRWLRPFLFSEIETTIKKSEASTNITPGVSLTVGYELSNERTVAENGWDRYDHLETRKLHNLGSWLVGSPYLSLGLYGKEPPLEVGIFLNTGLRHIIRKKLTTLGRETSIDFDDVGWFVGGDMRIIRNF